MGLKDDLYSRLSTYPGITALISTRIYPGVGPEGMTSSYAVYSVVSRRRVYSLGGFSHLTEYRVQVSCFAQLPLVSGEPRAQAIAEQVIAAMENWPATNSKVQSCLQDGQEDLPERAGSVVYEHVALDFLIQYEEE